MRGSLGSINKRMVFFFLVFVLVAVIGVIAQVGQNKNIDIALEYGSGAEYDPDNDGVETIGNIIDLTVENSAFDWAVDYGKLCTKWSVNSVDVCYGAEDCCSFIGLNPMSANWDDAFYLSYGRYNSIYANVVSAQVVYVDYGLGEEPYEDIVYSDEGILDANFEKRRVNVPTKIEEFIVKPDSVSRGEIVDVSATLYQNSVVFANQELHLYVDMDLADTQLTDDYGNAVFDLDTSSLKQGNHHIEVKFNQVEVSSDEEVIVYYPSSTDRKDLAVGLEVGASAGAVNIFSEEIKDCKMKYWDEEEPVYGICQKEFVTSICDDEPVNKSCHDETEYYNYTCRTGTQIVSRSEEICMPKELRITRYGEEGKIDFGDWGKCTTNEGSGILVVVCDSKYDGNNDGICQSGESCIKFVVDENGVRRYFRNSREEFRVEDESFFLEKLDYEVVLK